MPLSLASPLASFPLSSRLRWLVGDHGTLPAAAWLTQYPFRYEDRTAFPPFPQQPMDEPVCVHGFVRKAESKSPQSGRGTWVEVTVKPEGADVLTQGIVLRFFHMPWIKKSFPVDTEVIVFGRVKRSGYTKLVMDHPEFEILGDDEAGEAKINLERLVPIHRGHDGLTPKTIRSAIFHILEHLPPESVPDVLRKPSDQGEFRGMTRFLALRDVHFAESLERKEIARRYLALEEFFALQLNVLKRRREWEQLGSQPRCGPGVCMEQWLQSLPFSLTGAQLRTISEVRADLQRSTAMNRLVQGDVGSGKTFVAMAAILLALETGCQAALMAPTQILAEQHYANFQKHLGPLGIRLALRTGNRKESSALELWDGEAAPQLVIGTHALISDGHRFEDLGLVVIDEQHKFGVQQRAALIRQGKAPHVLAMTATPIPRTLTMSVYGDMEVSIIDEMPAGRGTVQTSLRGKPDVKQVAAFLQQQVAAGRQAYLVYPLVEESDATKLRAAKKEFAGWQERLAPISCGLLHGKLKPAEKEQVMHDFREQRTAVLVATSVIEVGVDVPNANTMIIFEADRFGLAQLHQLRGRIGRGEHKSYCLLVPSNDNPEVMERLKMLEQTNDGFAVAEEDLKLRGPGDLLGTAQSGLPGLQLGDLVRDQKLVSLARRLANEVLDADSTLQSPPYRHLQHLIVTPEEQETLT
jgi:ATP-dependent DNA helicase RecG